MEDSQILGAIIGGIAGLILNIIVTSPKFTYLGGNVGRFEGGAGCFKTIILAIVFIGAGILIGIGIGSL